MREYYTRFFREVKREMFIFWKGQIIGSATAGIITAVVDGSNGVMQSKLVWQSVGAVVIGYLTLLGIFFVLAAMRAPVNLDSARLTEIQTREGEIKSKQAKITTLEETLLKKHPADEHKEKVVREALADFSPGARNFILWLLHAGEVPEYRFGNSGVSQAEMNEALSKGRGRTLIKDRNDSPAGRTYSRINDELKDAIRDVLHPPDRPVTPPSA